MQFLPYVLEVPHNQSPSLLHTLEAGLGLFAGLLKIGLEFLAVALILYSTVIMFDKYIRYCRRSKFDAVEHILRLELGRYLSLALELLLAADIVATAVSPDWDAIAKLGAISLIRTFLNYFLEREIHQLENIPTLNAMQTKS